MDAIVTKVIHCAVGATTIIEDKFSAMGILPMVLSFKQIEHKSLFLFL